VVPISHSQDTPGPMARSVDDAAILLGAMAGGDLADAATASADTHRSDYRAGLAGATLKGRRLGVLRFAADLSPDDAVVFAAALAVLKAQGAEIVDLKAYKPPPVLADDERSVLTSELKVDLDAYLATTPQAVHIRSLGAVIAFDRAEPREMALFGQDLFEKAEATGGLKDSGYLKARAESLRLAGAEGIDKLLAGNRLDALIAPSYGPASRIDVVGGNNIAGKSSSLPAIAGDPHLTVPMGQIGGLPVGLSFIGPAWSEAKLLALGGAYERATHARKPPLFIPSLETTPTVERASAALP
jgi:amidase